MARGQQFELGAARREPLARVEHVPDVLAVGGDRGDADERAPVQVQMSRLGDRDGESLPQFGHHRPHHGSLLLQRMHVVEQQVKL